MNIVTLDGLTGLRARTQRLEVARDTYVERVRADERLSKFEFLVVLDCDNVNAAPVDLAVVSDALSFLKSVSDIAGVFSNSKGLYFDL